MKTTHRRKLLSRLFILELKTLLKAMPRLLLGTVLLCALLGGLFYCANSILYKKESPPRMTLAIVSEETSSLTSSAVNFVSGMDSTKDLFQFSVVTEEKANEDLRTGKAAAILKLPSGLMESILNGSNQTVQVILPDTPGLSSVLLAELTKAGAKTLGCAQSGIYTVTDLYITGGMADYLQESYDALNNSNLKYALARNRLFLTQSTSASGEIPLSVYYTAAAIISVLMLSGTVYGSIPCARPPAFTQKLQACSISGSALLAIKLAAVFISFVCTVFILLPMVSFLSGPYLYKMLWTMLTPASVLSVLMILLYVSSFTLLIFQIGKSPGNSILLLIFCSVAMLLLSGAFIPSAFFPTYIRRFSDFLPTAQAISELSALILNNRGAAPNWILFFHSLVCFLLSLLAGRVNNMSKECS